MINTDETLLEICDSHGSTPLTLAFIHKHLQVAHGLINKGASLFANNQMSTWPMRYIVEHNGLKRRCRDALVEGVIIDHPWYIKIFQAVWRRDLKAAKEILQHDPSQASAPLADPDYKDKHPAGLSHWGVSPLHYAVIAGDKRMVRLLLEAGAKVDAVPHGSEPDDRHTPMFYVPKGCSNIAELLVEHGAKHGEELRSQVQ